MQANLYASITALTFSETLSGGALSWPVLVAGKHISLRLTLSQKIEGAHEVLRHRTVHGIKASLGKVDARPESGNYQLMIGGGPETADNVTVSIGHDATARALQDAINAVVDLSTADPVVTCKVRLEDGSYIIRFSDGAEREITCIDNSLWPQSFVLASASKHDEGFVHTLRLVQAPVAQTVLHSLFNPQVPYVERVQEGGGTEDGTVSWNEIQQLALPADFNAGAFQLRRGFRRSSPIGLPTTGQEIADAIAVLADEDGEFLVTEQQDAVLIEFAGESMKGRAQDLLVVTVIEGPEPAIAFTLDTATAEMEVMMKRPNPNGLVVIPLELELTLVDPDDEDVLHPYSLRADLSFRQAIGRDAMNVAAALNWNQPLARRSYAPFGPGQFLIGQRHAQFVIGDGTTTAFTLNHNLDDDTVAVIVRDNAASGSLWHDADYEVEFDGPNALTVTFASAPAAESLVVVITTASHPATFVAHTHTIADITGLEARLGAIEAAIAELEAHAPTGGFSTTGTSAESLMSWPLERFLELYPRRRTDDLTEYSAELGELKLLPPSLLIRDGGLLPAVHDAETEPLVLPLEYDAANTGKVFVLGGDDPVRLPGGRGRKGVELQPGEFAAYDGARWYRVAKYADAETSFYPTDFERELFSFVVSEGMFPIGHSLKVELGLELQMAMSKLGNWQQLTANKHRTSVQWRLVIERGEITSDSSPSTPGANLDDIVWNVASPLLLQDINITHSPIVHFAGVHIARTASAMTAKQLRYSTTAEAGNTPTGFPFALRGRLCCFDTENSVADPRGIVALLGLNRDAGSANGLSDLRGMARIVKS